MVFEWSNCKVAGVRVRVPKLRLAGRTGGTTEFAPLLSALYRRQLDGDVTTLRDLHKITPFSQSQALKMVRGLEERRLVEVESKPHDRLGSTVRLTTQAVEVLSITREAA